MVAVDALGGGEDEGSAALGLQAEGTSAGQYPDVVRPGARGVDQHGGAETALVGMHLPQPLGVTLHPLHLAIAAHFALLPANAAQVALVQGIGVDVAGARVVEGAMDFVPTQHRQAGAGLVGIEQLEFGHAGLGAEVLALQFGRIAVEVDGHLTARGEQRMLGETTGRMIEKARLARVRARTCGVP